MRKAVTLELNREELLLLAGMLYYSDGDVLAEAYHTLTDGMTPTDLQRVKQIAREIAVKANGYYIDEDDLLYALAALDSHWGGVK